MKTLPWIALLFAWTPFCQADVVDYKLTVIGGRTTMQGADLPFTIQSDIVPAGLPPVADGVNLDFFDQASGQPLPYGGIDFTCVALCQGTYPHYQVYGIGAGATVALPKFVVAANATPGIHTILIRGTSQNGGVVRTVTIDVNVLSQAQVGLPQTPFLGGVAIPQRARWESDMALWGTHWCDASLLELIDQSVTFYDGPRVYYQIRDYTSDPKWDTCTRFASDAYASFVNTHGGHVQGYYVFTKGMRTDAERTGTATSIQALQSLYAGDGWWSAPEHSTTVDNMRENSYGLQTKLDEGHYTGTYDPSTRDLMQGLLGQLDQVFIQKKFDWFQPFMVGLAMDALIQYYNEKEKDPRIPYIIKQTLDGLWDVAWMPQGHGFAYRCYIDGCYDSDDGTGTGTPFPPVTPKNYNDSQPNLNNLISPAFAWMYLQTGDPKYRERADSLFANGVLYNAVNWKGKEFSQNYRWSFDYVKWRDEANAKNHVVVTDNQPPVISVVAPLQNSTIAGSTLTIADASDNIYVTAVQFKVDGVNAGAPLTSRPFEFNWATFLYPNGPHTLSAVAYDAAGNSSESAPVTVTIQHPTNNPMDTCPSTSIPWESFQGCYFQHGITNYQTDMLYDVNHVDAAPAANLGTLMVVRNDPAIHFDWSTTNPAPGVDNSFFGVLWQGHFNLKPGAYTFSLTRDQGTGLRVYIDGSQFFEAWYNAGSPTVSTFTVSYPYSGTHLIRVELWRAYTNTGDSVFKPFDVSWVWNELPITMALPDPILHLPSTLPVNANIHLENASSYTGANFTWTFVPQTSAPSANGLSLKTSASLPSIDGTSRAPQFSLSSLALVPGPYLISVQANDGFGFYSNTVSVPITLVAAPSNVSTITVYPNPWRSDKHSTKLITFDRLHPDAIIKIFTLSGRLVREFKSSGTMASWDLTNESGDMAASGVYMYLVTDSQGTKIKGKLAILK